MPSNAANAGALSASNFKTRVYCSVMDGDEILNATVTAKPNDPYIDLAISVVSGSAANVRAGMRVEVETSGGLSKGWLVVRSAGTISSSNIPVRETGFGAVEIAAADVLRVYDDFPLIDKLVSASETFDPDHRTYTDENEAPAPVICSGGHVAVWLGAVGSVAIPRIGSSSYVVDPDSGGDINHTWQSSGGTLDDDESADPTLTITSAGKYRVDHTGEDADNGNSRTQYTRIRVHDDNDPPIEVDDITVDGDADTGYWAASATFSANADLATIRDNAPCLFWTVSTAAGELVDFGTPVAGQHLTLFYGFARRDTNAETAEDGTVTIEFISPLQRLAELPGFSKVMLREASPDAWNEIKSLTVQRGIIQIAAYYTTLIESGEDLIFSGFDDADYSALFLNKSTPHGQMKELAESRAGRIICTKYGRIEVQERLAVAALPTRTGITQTLNISADDIDGDDGIEFEREHWHTVETFHTKGFTAGTDTTTNQPTFAKWPSAPGLGTDSGSVERLIVDNVSAHFRWCARLGAEANGTFVDANSVLQVSPTASLTLVGAYWHIVDFYREYYGIDLDATTNERGVDLSGFRWELKSASIRFENGAAFTTLNLRAETYGTGAVDDTPESEEGTGLGSIDYTLPSFELPPLSTFPVTNVLASGIKYGDERMALICDDGHIRRTFNWEDDDLVYDDQDKSASFVGTPLQWCFDANPNNRDTEGWSVDDAAGASDGGVYKLSTLFGAPVTVTQQPNTLEATPYRNIDASFGAGGKGQLVAISSMYTADESYRASISENGGAAWAAEVQLGIDGFQPGTSPTTPGVWVDSRTGDVYSVGRSQGSVDAGGYNLYRRVLGVETWTRAANILDDDSSMGTIIVPYAELNAPRHVYYGYLDVDGVIGRYLYRATLPDTAGVNISPTYGGASYGPDHECGRFTFAVSPANPNRAVGVFCNFDRTLYGVATTSNLTATTPTWTWVITPGAGVDYRRVAMLDDNRFIVFGINLSIAYTGDGGVSWVDKSGNLSGTAEIIGITA